MTALCAQLALYVDYTIMVHVRSCTFLQVVVPGSLSLAWHLGMSVMKSHAAKSDPIAAILQLYQGSGKLLFSGKVTDIVRHTHEGFVRGFVRVSSSSSAETPLHGNDEPWDDSHSSRPARCNQSDPIGLMIEFQNENLVAMDTAGKVLACVPDLICILETSSGLAVATEEIRYGLWVSVLVLPSHPLLRTPTALEVVGPAAFGYPSDRVPYTPVGPFPSMPTVHEEFPSQPASGRIMPCA